MPARVSVIGDALLDVRVVPAAAVRPGEDIPAAVGLSPGGQGANLAVRLARRGVPVSLTCSLADDVAGRILRTALEADGVDLRAVDTDTTGVVVVLLDDRGERTMLSQRVPFAAAAAEHVTADGWVLLSGYLLLEPAGMALARAAAAVPGRRVLLGCAVPDALAAAWRSAAAAFAPDLVVMNSVEMDRLPLAGDHGRAVTDAGGATATIGAVTVDARMAAGPDAVDTTGAGDAFAAALVAELLDADWPPPTACPARGARARRRARRRRGAGTRRPGSRRAGGWVVTPDWLAVGEEVRAALADGRAVVALESSLIAQGLPVPHNLDTALAAEAAVRESGAVPATAALEGGRLVVGADRALLDRLADPERVVAKAGSRDLGPLLASGALASTTVSATMRAAHLAGIAVFATGGIGGVHRGAASSFDVSSDIDELAATPVAVVSSGAKSILDLPATLELLETRRVPVVGYGVDELPAFYSVGSGLSLAHRVDGPQRAAAAIAAHRSIPGAGGMLIVQPPPADLALDPAEVDAWIAEALVDAERNGIRGGAVTPHLLAHLAHASGGRTLRVNIGLIVANARTAGRIASVLT